MIQVDLEFQHNERMENIQQLSAVIRCRRSLSKGSRPLHNLLNHNNLFDWALLAWL